MACPAKTRTCALSPWLPLALGICLCLSACAAAGNGSANVTPPIPQFISTPGTAATQDVAYSYQIETAASTGSVTLALAAAPSGAALNGSTLTWTPSAAQSRVSNQLSVTATNSAGSATQSWSVTPAGTVGGTFVITYWTSNGPVNVPFDWTAAASAPLKFVPRALIPKSDGSFQVLLGSGNSDGTFSIPNVSGGYYWLQPTGSLYWTSSSTVDLGVDFNFQAPSSGKINTVPTTTQMSFNFSGMAPLQTGDVAAFVWQMFPPFSLAWPAESPAGATSLTTSALITSSIDFSQGGPAFFLQYQPEYAGTLSALELVSEDTLPNLTMSNGTSNSVNAPLVQSTQNSFDLNIAGSEWLPLFNGLPARPRYWDQILPSQRISSCPPVNCPQLTRGISPSRSTYRHRYAPF